MEDLMMSFWTFALLLFILGVFVTAQLVKLLNSESKAGELAREFAWSVIDRVRHGKDTAPEPTEKE
jgi:hypothetical protein